MLLVFAKALDFCQPTSAMQCSSYSTVAVTGAALGCDMLAPTIPFALLILSMCAIICRLPSQVVPTLKVINVMGNHLTGVG